MKKKFSLIISNTARSFEYLKCLSNSKLIPEYILYLNNNSNNKFFKIFKKKKFFFSNLKPKIFKTKKINKSVSKYILSHKTNNIIYSGYPGIILKNKKLLSQKNLIHSHPGKLPEYKGSTTIYYSLLKDKKIFCSTLILNNKIDSGEVLFIKKYSIPKNIKKIDKDFDNKIRSKNILLYLKKCRSKNIVSKNKNTYPYFVIHPLLRSIVFKKYEKNF